MRIGIPTRFNSLLVETISKAASVPLEMVWSVTGDFLCPVEDFESLAEGLPKIREVQKALQARIGGSYEIWVKENNVDGFVTGIDYANQLEQVLNKLTKATDRLTRIRPLGL